jgi:hypothetical protein
MQRQRWRLLRNILTPGAIVIKMQSYATLTYLLAVDLAENPRGDIAGNISTKTAR